MQKRKIYILHLFGAISTSLLTLAILLSLSSCLEYQNTAFQWQINPAVEQVNTWNPWKPTNYIINDRQGHLYMTGQRISPASKLAVAKYNLAGGRLWLQLYENPLGESGVDMGYSVALDAAGDVYVAGNAKGIYSNTDLIVLKYDAAGNLLWEYRSPPLNPDTIYTKQHITPHQLNISDSGDIHVFIDTNRSSYGSIILNTQGIVLREFVLPGLLDTELQRFLAKIDNTGNIVAFNQLQKSDIRSPYADSLIGQKIKKFDSFGMLLWEIDNLNVHHIETLLLDQANDILAVTITYEAGKFVKKLAKINSVDGTTQWSIDFPGTLYWGPTTLAIDEQNNIYIDDVNFYSTTVVAKVSPSGELLWKSTPVFTNPANQEVKLNTDSTGRVLLTRLTSNNGLMDRTYKGLMVRTYVFNAQGHFITTIDALDTDIAWTGVDVQDHVYHLTVPVIANNHTLTLTQYLVPN